MELEKRIATTLRTAGVAAAHVLVATIEDPVERRLGRAALALLEHDPATGDACGLQLELAASRLAAARFVEARALLHQILGEQPGNVEARLALARASTQLGDYEEALRQYTHVFDHDPEDARPIAFAIEMFVELGKWLGAIAAVRSIGRERATTGLLSVIELRLFARLAGTLPARGTLQEVDDLVEASVAAAAGRTPGQQLAVAGTILELGRHQEAKILIDRVETTTAADQSTRHYLLGVVAEAEGDRSTAIDAYRTALALDPRHVAAATNAVGMLLTEASEPALAHVPAILALVEPLARGSSPHLIYNEAIFAVHTDELPQARDLFAKLLALPCPDRDVQVSARRALAELFADEVGS